MFSANSGKITVRNLPPETVALLSALATQHDRSLEGEVRHALSTWVAPRREKAEQARRAEVVARRLQFLLDEFRSSKSWSAISPSRISEQLGLAHADAFEKYFNGETEPSFETLRSIATLLGCWGDWLVHGDETPFSGQEYRLDWKEEAVTWLTTGDNGLQLRKLLIVRSLSDAGQLAFVKVHERGHSRTYHTQYHVSEVIGASGERELANLLEIFRNLYAKYTMGGTAHTESLLVPPALFSRLIEGKKHPLNTLESHDVRTVKWWEDIWDAGQYPRQDYWPGWRSLTERFGRYFAHERAKVSDSALGAQEAEKPG